MIEILQGDCIERLRAMPDESVQCCVTSPPYFGLRDYGMEGQIGLEATPDAYVAKLVEVFAEVWRVLRDDGTLWLNLGDSYSGGGRGNYDIVSSNKGNAASRGLGRPVIDGLKPKDLIGIPWRVAFALQAAGWYLRQDIIWHKPNPMPESVTDRCTKAHEYIFLLTKSARYFYDHEAVKEPCESGPSDIKKMLESKERIGGKHKELIDPLSKASSATNIGQKRSVGSPDGRNKRSVWTVGTQPYAEAHFATFPTDLIKPCILAGTRPGDVVLDPFGGSGTTGMVALELSRRAVLIELNPEYVKLCHERCTTTIGLALETMSEVAGQ